MSQENFNNYSKPNYESLSDLNFLGLWFQCGADWSLMIQQEVQSTLNQANDKKQSKPNRVLVLGVLATLGLLGAAVWIPAPKIYQVGQEPGKNPVEQRF